MIKRNIIANYAGRGWSAISAYIFVPLYIRYLGVESYGLVAFYTVLLGSFAFTNFGLTGTLNRELARYNARIHLSLENTTREMRDFLRTIEIIFWCIAAIVAMLVVAGAPLIARHWLHGQGLPPGAITRAVMLMGLAMGLLLPYDMYQGGLVGLERQVISNALIGTVGLLRGAGAVLILRYVSPTIQAFFTWQILVNLIQLILVRSLLWRYVPRSSFAARFDLNRLKSVWRYALGLMGITVNAVILMQTDKLIVSNMVSLESFGHYSLAVMVSQAPTLLSGPVAAAIFPRLTRLWQLADRKALIAFYHRACQIVSVASLPVAMVLVGFSREFLHVWTRNFAVAQRSSTVASWLLVGSAVLALQVVPFNLALASGWTKLNYLVGLGSLLFMIPIMYFLVRHYGVIGAGISWLTVNTIIAAIYITILHRRLLPSEQWKWLISDAMIPLAASAAPVAIIRHFISGPLTTIQTILVLSGAWCAAQALALGMAPVTREYAIIWWRRLGARPLPHSPPFAEARSFFPSFPPHKSADANRHCEKKIKEKSF